MDNRKSMKRDHPEDATKTDSRNNDNMRLLKLKSIFSIPELISSTPLCSNDDVLIAYDMEQDCEYGTVKGNEMYYVSEWSIHQSRVIAADWKKKRLEMYENEKLINVPVTQAVYTEPNL